MLCVGEQDRSKYVFVPRSLGLRLRVTMHLTSWFARLLNQVHTAGSPTHMPVRDERYGPREAIELLAV